MGLILRKTNTEKEGTKNYMDGGETYPVEICKTEKYAMGKRFKPQNVFKWITERKRCVETDESME